MRLLDHVRARIVAFQEETGHMYNLEATPAEGTTYRFAKEDRKRFPTSCRPAPTEQPYYTNSSQLPVGFTDDPFEALERQERTAAQIHRRHRAAPVHERAPVLGGGLPRSWCSARSTRFRLPYITVTPTFSICPKHGYLDGEHAFCPKCDDERARSASVRLPLLKRQTCMTEKIANRKLPRPPLTQTTSASPARSGPA